MLKTDLVDCKAFQGTFLAGIKANALSTKLHYNPLKLTANPASNLSRELQRAEQKPEAVLRQARSETNCWQTLIASTFCNLKGFALTLTEKYQNVSEL